MKPIEAIKEQHASITRIERGRLFRRYFMLILALVCGALLISGGIGLYFSYQENKVALASLQHEKALSAATRIEQFVLQIEQQLAYAALPQLGDDLEQRRIELLKLIRVAHAVTDITYIDAKGREQLFASRIQMEEVAAGRDWSQEPAFRNARPGQTWYGPVYFRKETEPYMAIAVRSGGEAGPVTVAEVNLKFIWDVVKSIRIGQKGKAYVVDGTGHLVADPDIGLVLRKTDLSGLEQVKAALQPDADDALAVLAKDLAGNRVLTAYAPIEPARDQPLQGARPTPLGWKVFVEQPVSEVFQALDATVLRTVALMVAGLLFSALAAMWLARSMARPISILQEGAQRIGAGDLDTQIQMKTGDELESLADQFNRMTGQLRESYAGLERKVEERTIELKQALEFQGASGEILSSISSSIANTQPVFDAIVRNLVRLLDTEFAIVRVLSDGKLQLAAFVGQPGFEKVVAGRREQPVDMQSASGRAFLSRQVIQFAPISGHPDMPERTKVIAREAGYDAIIAAPMVREDRAVGVIAAARKKGVAFSDKQVALIKAFADQAVIAIENARLVNETKLALERQTAVSQVLKTISQTTFDLQAVFDVVVENATKLCRGDFGYLFRREGDVFHMVASSGGKPELVAYEKANPTPITRRTLIGRVALDRALVHMPDALADPEYDWPANLEHDVHSLAAVPIISGDEVVGAIGAARFAVDPFSPEELGLFETFADQAAIAIENVRLFNETKEALERQTAISEILRVISGSPTDVQPVLDAIAESARQFCAAEDVSVLIAQDTRVSVRAHAGPMPPPSGWFAIDRTTVTTRSMVERATVHVADLQAETIEYPVGSAQAAVAGQRTTMATPLLREGRAVGAILLRRSEVRPFTDKQIELLRTFADQAVIAIENVRLFNETKESLEQQTATAKILEVIAGSPTDVQPVFDAIASSAMRLFELDVGAVTVVLARDTSIELAALAAHTQMQAAWRTYYPLALDASSITGRTILEKKVQALTDLDGVGAPELDRKVDRRVKVRSVVGAPMIREGRGIGAVMLFGPSPAKFSEKQLALLRTFADQAAIAVENVRLFNETKESLDRQTAISEVLRVISSSPGDVKPTLDAVASRATRLCEARAAGIYVLEGQVLRRTAFNGPAELQGTETLAFNAGTLTGRTIAEGKAIHIENLEREQGEFPMTWELAQKYGRQQSMLAVPLMREGRPFGTMFLRRTEVRPFSDEQIALATTFADQAAIAIENVRLFNETKEALEQQKASGEVLGAISSSIADTKPVFDKILRSCERLFAGKQVGINLVDADGKIRIGAYHGPGREELERLAPFPAGDASGSGAAMAHGRVMHYPVAGADEVPPVTRRGCAAIGVKAAIFAPMLWEGRGIGVIFVGRDYVGQFSEKEIALLKTFADQAVIAIQNARLFREIQEKSAQLEVANKHKSDFLANMSHELRTPLNAIIGFSEVLIERMFGELNEKQADYLKDIHESGRHLLSLINDILDLSKIEAGRMDLELSSFHLPTALSNAMTLVRERAQRHGIRLALDVDPRLGEFQADERKFKQILLNLLSNAVKFTPDGGRVDVAARLDTTKVEIAVKDTGIGIAPEDQGLVFEEFKQVGRDYTRKAEGTGLGLALTKRFVELHGGEIRLESAPGKGSTFTVTLPVHP